MKRFTVAVSDEVMEAAKIAAIRSHKPLIHWAGEVIKEKLGLRHNQLKNAKKK